MVEDILDKTVAAEERAIAHNEHKAGVFVGIQHMEYTSLAQEHSSNTGPFTATGTTLSVAAGRLSYSFNLHGTYL